MDNQSMDNIIKKYLEERTIQPSTQTWDRLDAMLTTAEKPKKRFTIHYVLLFAACLVSALIMFVGQDVREVSPVLVPNKVEISHNEESSLKPVNNNESIIPEDDNIDSPIPYKKSHRKAVVQEVLVVNTNNVIAEVKEKSNPVEQEVVTNVQTTSTIASTEMGLSEVSKTNIVNSKSTLKINPESLLASINNLQRKPSNAIVPTSVKKNAIDPTALLDEAENDVARSFLVRTLTSLRETSGEIITSVSSRNQVKQ